MKRVGIYIRVSTEEQARIQDGSLVSQKNRLLEYIEYHNKMTNQTWGTLVDVYCDEGKSAKDMNRPEFKRLLQDIQMGKVDLILATELSRLSRNIRDFCEIWDLLKKHSCSFITLRENFDTTTASGEMMVFNLINHAQYERKQTAERISANWLSRSKRGLWNGGTLPLGYDRNPKNKGELVVNEKEANTVRKIFSDFLEIGSVRRAQVHLIEQGITNKKYTNKHGVAKQGGIFTVGTLQSLLTNKAYIGKKVFKDKSGNVMDTPAVWKSIVDELTFNQVQERLQKNKNRYKPEEWKVYPFPLTELVKCGECGKHMGGKSGHGRKEKYFYYGHAQLKNPLAKDMTAKCQMKNVRAQRLEEIMMSRLYWMLQDEKVLDHWIEIYKSKSKNDLPEVRQRQKQLDIEIQTTGKRIDNLVQRVSDLPPEVSADLFYKQINQMTQKLKELELAKEKTRSQSIDIMTQEIDEVALREKIRTVSERLKEAPKDKQRPLFTNLFQFIELHPMKIAVGIIAPTKAQKGSGDGNDPDSNGDSLKPTGTDGPFPLPSNRVGSSSVGSGASGRN